MSTRRNPVVRHGAILRKGGAHTKSVSGKRHQSKRRLDNEIDEYFDQRVEVSHQSQKERDDSAPSSPLSFLLPEFLIKQLTLASMPPMI